MPQQIEKGLWIPFSKTVADCLETELPNINDEVIITWPDRNNFTNDEMIAYPAKSNRLTENTANFTLITIQ